MKVIIKKGEKYLITTDAWFYGPNGEQYRAAWGKVEIVSDSILGVKTNSKSSNWFVKCGNKDKFIIIAGCQIHYVIRCPSKPHTGPTKANKFHEGVKVVNTKNTYDTTIYIAE